jgi:hypothetical protein
MLDVPRRNLESFGSFPTSIWANAFEDDLAGAKKVRIGTGFIDRNGARAFVEAFDPETSVEVLVGIAGCSGPEVIEELQQRPGTLVRGSVVLAFHWKVALIESTAGPVLYVGSANFTRKGLSGEGEIMLRIAGSALTSGLWDSIQSDFDAYFAEGTTLSGNQLIEVLARVENKFDAARGAQADFEEEIERILAEARTEKAVSAGRIWMVVWDDSFSDAESAIIDRSLGVCPSNAWTRGEVTGRVVRGLEVGDIVLGYQRDGTYFVLGQVGRYGRVALGRNYEVWIAYLEHVVDLIESAEHPKAYQAIRKVLPAELRRDGGPISRELYQQVLAALRQEGLLP